jgi:hypothetical protein
MTYLTLDMKNVLLRVMDWSYSAWVQSPVATLALWSLAGGVNTAGGE